MNWYLDVLKKYAIFTGRSRRKEYWMFFLFNILISIALSVADMALGLADSETGSGPISLVYSLAVFIPSIAVGIRRLHDVDRSGWWTLVIFVPLIGLILLLYWFCKDGTPGDNRFGPNPKEVSPAPSQAGV